MAPVWQPAGERSRRVRPPGGRHVRTVGAAGGRDATPDGPGPTRAATGLPAAAHITGPAAANSGTHSSTREPHPLPRPDSRIVAPAHGPTTLDGPVAAHRDAFDALAQLDTAVDTAVARTLGTSPWWAREQAHHGRIPHLRLGTGRIRLLPEHVDALIALFSVDVEDVEATAAVPVDLGATTTSTRAHRRPPHAEDSAALF
jgi:hypothetical protein